MKAAEKKEEQANVAIGIGKLIAHGAVYTGAGAVAGAILKNQNLSDLKGLGKLCAGVGCVGIAHWISKNAAETIDEEIDGIIGFIHNMTAPKEEQTDGE